MTVGNLLRDLNARERLLGLGFAKSRFDNFALDWSAWQQITMKSGDVMTGNVYSFVVGDSVDEPHYEPRAPSQPLTLTEASRDSLQRH